jgi:hypothetical protein
MFFSLIINFNLEHIKALCQEQDKVQHRPFGRCVQRLIPLTLEPVTKPIKETRKQGLKVSAVNYINR